MRKTCRLLLVAPLCFLSVQAIVYGDSRTDQVDALFAKWDRPDSPGCALGIIEEGRFVYKRGYGMADLEYDIPISSTSVFRTGSVSKQFTTMSVLLAAAEAKLSLDDDVRKFMPEMPDYGRIVTIRHLIHHTSGVRDYLTLMFLAGKREEDYYTNREVLESLSRLENLNFSPGDEYLYSNSGYWLLSQIIERATGKTLRQWAREEIFEPLNMVDTHFHDDPRMIVENRASGYRRKKDDGFEIDMTQLEMVGDGGIFTTIDDLLKWDRNFDTKSLGGEAAMKAMLTPGKLDDGTVQNYAGGLVVSTYRGLPIVEHGGAFVGFRAGMLRFPEQQFSAYCLCNLSEIDPMELLRKTADIYLEEHLEDEQIHTVALPESALREKVGTYWDGSRSSLIEVEIESGNLRFTYGGEPFQLEPLGEDQFMATSGLTRAELRFIKGSPPRVQVQFEGQRLFDYERVTPVSPDPKELESYRGRYECRELDATYEVDLGGAGRLVVEVELLPDQTLEPVFQDVFRYELGNVEFHRDADGKVTGFRLSAGRARNFEFVRSASEPSS